MICKQILLTWPIILNTRKLRFESVFVCSPFIFTKRGDFLFWAACKLYVKKFLNSPPDLSTFYTSTATSSTTCGLMAHRDGRMGFIWQKEGNQCLVTDILPGKFYIIFFLFLIHQKYCILQLWTPAPQMRPKLFSSVITLWSILCTFLLRDTKTNCNPAPFFLINKSLENVVAH